MAPMFSGYKTLRRLLRLDIFPGMIQMFNGDRLARAAGQAPAVVPISDQNQMVPSALASAEAFAICSGWEGKLVGK